MAISFTNTSDAAARGIKVLCHSESGAGKTYMTRTLLDGGHSPIIISAEGGNLSLRDVSIPVVEVSTFADVQESYEYLTQSKEAQQYDWVVIDSLSEILEVLLNYEKARCADPRQAYGALRDKGQEMVRSFRDMPKSVYFTAKQEFIKDEHGRSFFALSTPGSKLQQDVPFLLDEVFALRVWEEDGKLQRKLQTAPDGRYQAKDRSGKLDFLEEPNLAAIAKKICA